MSQTWDVTLIEADPDAPDPYVEARGAPGGEVTVHLKALDGTWEVCGADRARGVWPENVKGIRADGWGSKTAGFDLRRDPKAIWPDIGAFTPVQIDIDGIPRWSGRVAQTPVRDDLDSVISVQCEGWQAHLDDDVYERWYVHTRLSDWKDARSHLSADLAALRSAWQVDTSGGVKISFPSGVPADGSGMVYLDAGPGSTIKQIGWTASSSAWAANNSLYVLGGSTFAGLGAESYNPGSIGAGTSYTDSFTFSTPRRFVAFRIDSNGHTPAADEWFKLEQIVCVRESAYLSGLSSVLKADVIVKHALSVATDDEIIDADTSLIEAGTFNIPEFAMGEPRTPRQVWEAADAFEDRVRKIDVHRRPVYKAKPTVPVAEVGAWSAMSFEDASANDGSEIYERVIVKATAPDGTPLRVERAQSQQPNPFGISTRIGRRGFQRTKVLDVSFALTTSAAEQLGDLFLRAHARTPFKGTVKLTGRGAARDPKTGTPLPVDALLEMTGEMIRFMDRVDPDTGAVGRDARIAEVSVDPDTEEATVTLDNSRAGFDALLARLDVVLGQNQSR